MSSIGSSRSVAVEEASWHGLGGVTANCNLEVVLRYESHHDSARPPRPPLRARETESRAVEHTTWDKSLAPKAKFQATAKLRQINVNYVLPTKKNGFAPATFENQSNAKE